MYFHSIIDTSRATSCQSRPVPAALPRPPRRTTSSSRPTCAATATTTRARQESPRGLPASTPSSKWIPIITASPAYTRRADDPSSTRAPFRGGLLLRRGARANQRCRWRPGGGAVPALALYRARTGLDVAYNHYSMLGSVEDIFGLLVSASPGTTRSGLTCSPSRTVRRRRRRLRRHRRVRPARRVPRARRLRRPRQRRQRRPGPRRPPPRRRARAPSWCHRRSAWCPSSRRRGMASCPSERSCAPWPSRTARARR